MSTFKLEDVPCVNCEQKGGIEHIARATWVCKHCGKDNSIFVVYMYEAVEASK